EAPLRGPDHGSAAPVEAEPDRPVLAQQMVRVLPRPRHDARGHGHEVRTLVHRALGRQATRPAQLHQPPARSDPLQEGAATEGEGPEALDETGLRRSGDARGPAVRAGAPLEEALHSDAGADHENLSPLVAHVALHALDGSSAGAPRDGERIRRMNFSPSTTRKKSRPAMKSGGQSESGMASVWDSAWSGGA